MKQLKIAVLFGGCSEEHDVSIKSAGEIMKNLDPEKYDPIPIGITKEGDWKMCDFPHFGWEKGPCHEVVLSPDRATHGLLVLEDGGYQIIRLDAVLPVLHGKTGEDGAIQGLLELSGIPYVGCGIESSALCMDKALAHLIVRNAGIATPQFWLIDLDRESSFDGGILTYPVFVKPARSGSSFGVTKVENAAALSDAIAAAGVFDHKVLIEEAIHGFEVGCAVLGSGDALTAGEVDQITLSHGFFRIHQENTPENGSENATITVPAMISAEDRKRVRETAKKIYQVLGCSGLARVDMFLKEDGTIVLNEVNTFPGCTTYSRYPRMMAAAGIPLSEVMDRCIGLAMEK